MNRFSLAVAVALTAAFIPGIFPAEAALLSQQGTTATAQKTSRVQSPDGRIAVDFYLDSTGIPRYKVYQAGKMALQESRLGLVRDDADFSQGLRLASESKAERVTDKYEILTAKRRSNIYQANRKTYHLQTDTGKKLDIVFQVSNDGVAFRYRFPETDSKTYRLTAERSSYHFLPESRAWLQPMATAKTGYAGTNPSYEEYYRKEIPVGTPSPSRAGWVYPALFRSGDTWLLVSESGLSRDYCATRLRSDSPDGEYVVDFPDPREVKDNGPAYPQAKLPWVTPWRFIVLGSLKTVTESMLGVDLADKPVKTVKGTPVPGKSSWSWVLNGDGQTTYPVQKRYIDYAAQMGWRYCLIDALWDKQIGYDKIKELVDYGNTKNVKILLWYNSAGDWNTTPQTPKSMLLTHEDRVREFERLKKMGVAGLKIDFFGGDGQSMIGYYLDILEDSAPYGLLLNFHGATLPRGLQRTYPHLMTVEAIRGEEFITFGQDATDEEPTHAAMLPFTRNVFDPMDFTPVVLDKLPRTQRRTTSAFELALSVLFTSGIQHYAETPEGLAKAPDYVQEFLKRVPSVWEDTKFIDGYPGKYAVLARRGDGRWYVSGINAETEPKTVKLDLSQLPGGKKAQLITDGEVEGNLSFARKDFDLSSGNRQIEVPLKPRGGFVLVIE